MPGYLTKHECVSLAGLDDLTIRSLLDRQQFSDPTGLAEHRGISSAAWPLFGLLWPSGAHLASHLALRPVLAGERILELGCGLGLASLVGHRRGADVTASDCHPLAEAFLLENLRLNGLLPMKYRHGQWGLAGAVADEVSAVCRVQGEFDLIIGSDLLYERDEPGHLAAYIHLHAAPLAEVWIVDPDRGNRAVFNRCMAGHGFVRSERVLTSRPAAGGAGPAAPPAYKGRLLMFQRGAGGVVPTQPASASGVPCPTARPSSPG